MDWGFKVGKNMRRTVAMTPLIASRSTADPDQPLHDKTVIWGRVLSSCLSCYVG